MKKFTAFILAFILMLMPLTASAVEAVDDTSIMMGDLTNDRQISSADARLVLRIAAGIDSKKGVSMLSADADGNGLITAADARAILRVSAKIESFSRGFDADGMLNAVKLIKGERYTIEISISDNLGGGSEDAPISIATNGSDFCFKYLESFNFDSDEGAMSMNDMGVMSINGNIYMLVTINDAKMAITEDGLKLLGEMSGGEDAQYFESLIKDFSELINMANFMDSLIADDIGTPHKVTENGKDFFIYNYSAYEQNVVLKADSCGGITEILADEGTLSIKVNSISSEINSEDFNLDSYVLF